MRLPLLLVACIIAGTAAAQQRKIIGRVIDAETKKPLRNVNLYLPASIDSLSAANNGTTSNVMGYFELNFDESTDKFLVASHIGYVISEIEIPKGEAFQFSLEKLVTNLGKVNLNRFPRDLTALPVVAPENPKATGADGIVIESPAQPPGGLDRFYATLEHKLWAMNINSLDIKVMFTIDNRGKAGDVSISGDAGKFNEEIVKTFNTMDAWVPAYQRGIEVSQRFVIELTKGFSPEVQKATKALINALDNRPILRFQGKAGLGGFVDMVFHIDANGKVIETVLINDPGGGYYGNELRKNLLLIRPEVLRELARATHSDRFLLSVGLYVDKPLERLGPPPATDAYVLPELAMLLGR